MWPITSRRTLKCALLAAALAATAGGVAAQTVAAQQAFQRFAAANPGNWRAEWSGTGDQVTTLRGLTRGASGDPVGTAAGFIGQNAHLLGLAGGMRDLRLDSRRRSAGDTHVTYRQTYGGLPVFNGLIDVHVNRSGQVYLLHSTALAASRAPSLQPRLTRQSAAIVATNADLELYDKRGRRLMLPLAPTGVPEFGIQRMGDGSGRLAYRVDLGPAALIVDAASGAVLERVILMLSANGKGRVFNPNPVNTLNDNSLTDRNNSHYPALRGSYFNVTLLGLTRTGAGAYRLFGPHVRMLDFRASSIGTCMNGQTEVRRRPPNSDDGRFIFNRSQDGFEHTNVYHHIDRSQRYIQSLGFDDLFNEPIRIDAHAFTIDNSFYCGSPTGAGYLAFGDGGVDDAEDTDVVLHEYGHALQDAASNGRYLTGGQTGAMGEGFGDYWSFSAKPNGPWADCFAEWDADAMCLRRLDKNKRFPADYVGQVHADGEIWSRGLRDLLKKIGRKKADRIVLQSHFLVPPNPTFRDGLEALLDADQTLYGGANGANICNAFAPRGITSPQC